MNVMHEFMRILRDRYVKAIISTVRSINTPTRSIEDCEDRTFREMLTTVSR
jgi:hypothetical protein